VKKKKNTRKTCLLADRTQRSRCGGQARGDITFLCVLATLREKKIPIIIQGRNPKFYVTGLRRDGWVEII
jgi:hypothetical protein